MNEECSTVHTYSFWACCSWHSESCAILGTCTPVLLSATVLYQLLILLIGSTYIILPSLSLVMNFGTARIPSSGSETVFFSFNKALLANGVNVTRIRVRCEDLTPDMFLDYRPNFNESFTAMCSYEFQALSGDTPIGFPFSIQVDTPPPTDTGELSVV